jgi:hypothetical protein
VSNIALRSTVMGILVVAGVYRFRLSDELHELLSKQLARFGKVK